MDPKLKERLDKILTKDLSAKQGITMDYEDDILAVETEPDPLFIHLLVIFMTVAPPAFIISYDSHWVYMLFSLIWFLSGARLYMGMLRFHVNSTLNLTERTITCQGRSWWHRLVRSKAKTLSFDDVKAIDIKTVRLRSGRAGERPTDWYTRLSIKTSSSGRIPLVKVIDERFGEKLRKLLKKIIL